MATARPLLAGARREGARIVVPYRVKGLVHTTVARLEEAAEATGLPQVDELWPLDGMLKVIDLPAHSFTSGGTCIVDVTYGPSEEVPGTGGGNPGVIEVDGSVTLLRTMIDYGGTPIKVIYSPTNGGPFGADRECGVVSPGQTPNDNDCKGAEVDVYIPIVTARITRDEDGHPLIKAKLHVGTLNAGEFLGEGAESWLCTKIAGSANLNQRNTGAVRKYRVIYEFQFIEDGWHKIAAYVDPTTGKHPGDKMGQIPKFEAAPNIRLDNAGINQDRRFNGLTIVRVQGNSNFEALQLPSL